MPSSHRINSTKFHWKVSDAIGSGWGFQFSLSLSLLFNLSFDLTLPRPKGGSRGPSFWWKSWQPEDAQRTHGHVSQAVENRQVLSNVHWGSCHRCGLDARRRFSRPFNYFVNLPISLWKNFSLLNHPESASAVLGQKASLIEILCKKRKGKEVRGRG